MDKNTVALISDLLPIAIDLTRKLVDMAQAAKDNGLEIPGLDDIEALNSQLKELKDL